MKTKEEWSDHHAEEVEGASLIKECEFLDVSLWGVLCHADRNTVCGLRVGKSGCFFRIG